MSTPIKSGGPAFPRPYSQRGEYDFYIPQDGMTLRDYFAAQALPALVASALDLDHEKWDASAEHAYLIADAMLKARETNP